VARVITLENIAVQDALQFLQPVVSKDGHVSAFGQANMLLVVDSAVNIQKIVGIIQLIDTEKRREMADVVYLKNAAADNVAKLLLEWLGTRSAKPAGPQGATPFGANVIADTRLNALLVFGTDREKEDVRKLVALVDVPPPNSSSKVNVYPLENADATEVAKVLDGVVKGTAAAAAQTTQGAAPQLSPFEGGKITITPDKATNSLIVMASPTDYQNLLSVIQKLDRRRRQVFVQAVIAEVSLDKLQEMGIQWGFFGGGGTGSITAAGVYDPFSTLTPLMQAFSLIRTGGITNNNLELKSALNFPVILKALQSNDIVNVLSNPTLLTSDNKEAEIFVGENVPFLGQSTVSSTGTQQSIERKDTGITLKITPQINEGNYIKLDISEEISALKDTVTLGVASTDRTTTKRSAKTSVVVKDRETVAIGGMIQENDQETVLKVPLLGDVPLLGWLFRTKSVKRKKTNLILLLTPTVIRDERDLADASARQQERFSGALQGLDLSKDSRLKQATGRDGGVEPDPVK
jgi:general secretion pathway protein D